MTASAVLDAAGGAAFQGPANEAMYQHYYGLVEAPFELTTDPKFLYLTPGHREALSNLEYGLFAAKSITVLIGEVGTGKTTLLRAALQSERCAHVTCVYLNNPALTREEFVGMLAMRFQLGEESKASKAVLLERLDRVLKERREAGEITALVVDEAQSLSNELLEEIRLLANIETAEQKLLPLVLAGQPELSDRLEHVAIRQLKQRVALRCEIAPFDLKETAAYIASRIRTAGGTPSRLFTREAVTLIHEYAGGIPRTINVVSDNALVSGMALERQPVDREIVLEVCRDFRLRQGAPGAPSRLHRSGPHGQAEPATGAASHGDDVGDQSGAPSADHDQADRDLFELSKPRRPAFFGLGRSGS